MDISFAFGDRYLGVSFWKASEGLIQCNIKKANGGFTIDYGRTVEQAWENAVAQAKGAGQTSVHPIKKPRRQIEDLT